MIPVQVLREKTAGRQVAGFLRDIIKIKSLSGMEKKVARRVKQQMRAAGFDEVITSPMGSVIGRIGNGRKKILYDAHIDTVDTGDLKGWKYKPLEALYRNNTVYGRGACDDKGSVTAMVFAGKAVKQLDSSPDFTLWISASVKEEEAEGRGIAEVLRITGRPDYVVIGEPSSLKIIRGHKGRAGLKLTVSGKAVHASIPEKGVNAVYKMTNVIKKIEEYNGALPVNSRLGKGVVSVTGIESASASHNTIPDKCCIWIDRRTNEKDTENSVMEGLRKLAGKTARVELLRKFFPAWIIEKEHPLVETARKAFRRVFNKNPQVTLWPFCTNGSHTMGERNIPTIGFGPGDESLCHGTDEHISVREVMDAIKFYTIFPFMLV